MSIKGNLSYISTPKDTNYMSAGSTQDSQVIWL